MKTVTAQLFLDHSCVHTVFSAVINTQETIISLCRNHQPYRALQQHCCGSLVWTVCCLSSPSLCSTVLLSHSSVSPMPVLPNSVLVIMIIGCSCKTTCSHLESCTANFWMLSVCSGILRWDTIVPTLPSYSWAPSWIWEMTRTLWKSWKRRSSLPSPTPKDWPWPKRLVRSCFSLK